MMHGPPLHGLLLAGGEGSRLAADGVATPKALVTVGGRPQLVGLVEQFAALGCASLTCLVHADLAPLVDAAALATASAGTPVRVVPCRTPSSLHTFVAGLAAVPPGPVFCSMVDTVMAPTDWRAVHAAAQRTLDDGADALLAVTPDPDDDDAPLRVRVADGGRVTRVGGDAAAYALDTPVLITGGVYAFAPPARAQAHALAAAGGARMRTFLAALVDGGGDVRAAIVPWILDIDHRRDLDAANVYAATWGRSSGRFRPRVRERPGILPAGDTTAGDTTEEGDTTAGVMELEGHDQTSPAPCRITPAVVSPARHGRA